VDRPDKAKSKAGKDSKRSHEGKNKGSGDHATGGSNKDKNK
jgi:hypothetical protein